MHRTRWSWALPSAAGGGGLVRAALVPPVPYLTQLEKGMSCELGEQVAFPLTFSSTIQHAEGCAYVRDAARRSTRFAFVGEFYVNWIISQ